MGVKPRKAIVIPDTVKKLIAPMFAFLDHNNEAIGSDLRDPSKPVCYDANGQPLYAPLSPLVFTIPGPAFDDAPPSPVGGVDPDGRFE